MAGGPNLGERTGESSVTRTVLQLGELEGLQRMYGVSLLGVHPRFGPPGQRDAEKKEDRGDPDDYQERNRPVAYSAPPSAYFEVSPVFAAADPTSLLLAVAGSWP